MFMMKTEFCSTFADYQKNTPTVKVSTRAVFVFFTFELALRFKAIHITFVMLMICNFPFKSLPTWDSELPFISQYLNFINP